MSFSIEICIPSHEEIKKTLFFVLMDLLANTGLLSCSYMYFSVLFLTGAKKQTNVSSPVTMFEICGWLNSGNIKRFVLVPVFGHLSINAVRIWQKALLFKIKHIREAIYSQLWQYHTSCTPLSFFFYFMILGKSVLPVTITGRPDFSSYLTYTTHDSQLYLLLSSNHYHTHKHSLILSNSISQNDHWYCENF